MNTRYKNKNELSFLYKVYNKKIIAYQFNSFDWHINGSPT